MALSHVTEEEIAYCLVGGGSPFRLDYRKNHTLPCRRGDLHLPCYRGGELLERLHG